MSRLLVALQFSLMGLVLARAWPFAPGIAFAGLLAAGIAVGLWALAANRPGNFNIRPEPKEGGRLVTHGPYRWIRHPMYLAVLLVTGAFAWGGDAGQVVLLALLAGVLAAKARREERGLSALYPEWDAYRARTAAIIPGVF